MSDFLQHLIDLFPDAFPHSPFNLRLCVVGAGSSSGVVLWHELLVVAAPTADGEAWDQQVLGLLKAVKWAIFHRSRCSEPTFMRSFFETLSPPCNDG